MLRIVDRGRDEASCAAMERNRQYQERRRQVLITRWFVPWRLRKWMPEFAIVVRKAAQQEFERRARAHLKAEWNR